MFASAAVSYAASRVRLAWQELATDPELHLLEHELEVKRNTSFFVSEQLRSECGMPFDVLPQAPVVTHLPHSSRLPPILFPALLTPSFLCRELLSPGDQAAYEAQDGEQVDVCLRA